jgi:hypothetical protein
MVSFNLFSVILLLNAVLSQNNPASFRNEIEREMGGCSSIARLWIRAVFHDAGTFDKGDGSGGADGSLLLSEELARPENARLSLSAGFFRNFATRRGCTLADTISFSSIVAIEACGGPKLDFEPGRVDAIIPNKPGMLPSPFVSGDDIIRMFVDRMGFTAEEAVALIGGGHTVAKLNSRIVDGSNRVISEPGGLDGTPERFDNKFFKELVSNPGSLFPGNARIPADSNMANHPVLKVIVRKFANSNGDFFKAFKSAFEKMIKFGIKKRTLHPTPSPSVPATHTSGAPITGSLMPTPTSFNPVSHNITGTTTSSIVNPTGSEGSVVYPTDSYGSVMYPSTTRRASNAVSPKPSRPTDDDKPKCNSLEGCNNNPEGYGSSASVNEWSILCFALISIIAAVLSQ